MLERKKKPTVKDIARETGVSTTTVLNVLGNKTSEVSQKVAEKVMKKANELGYVRNLTAASLAGKGSHSFALIMTRAYVPVTPAQESDINPYYGEFILRLEHEARNAGLMLSLFGGREEDYVNFVLQRNLDAAVLMGIHKPDLPRIIAQRGIPVILIDCAFEDQHYISVRTDDMKAGNIAAEHLIKRGCKSIAYIGNTKHPANSGPSLRRRGARNTCKKAKVKFVELDHIATFDDGNLAATQVIEAGCDGVFTAADNLAAGLMHGLRVAGKKIPEDIAVIGYDNLLISRLVNPTLTTVDPGMSSKIKQIVKLIHDGKPGKTYKIEPMLIKRESA